ncbi:A24 family peptidase [Solirhodobacter olei]|uniref:A24 family peptidase n=1 Tax=Solirhodobacter olei TaxID=2493082 RepID=UPI000FD870BD|nr:prepilin peptidase [Solirhodobacter olei]
MAAMPAHAAMAFLPFALAIGIWVSWSDMKFMRIPNLAVIALALVFVVIGPLVLPWHGYLWQLVHFPVLLGVGFVLNLARAMGAGDAKYIAAMAPFFAANDAMIIALLLSAVLLAAFATHRILRQVPAMRRATVDWESWQRRDFPMGFALSGVLIFYLALVAVFGH